MKRPPHEAVFFCLAFLTRPGSGPGLQQRSLAKRLLRSGAVAALLGQCRQCPPGIALQIGVLQPALGLRHQLWGKAQQLLTQAQGRLQDAELRRNAWRALAALAEQRGDSAASQQALREAALL